MVKSDTKESGTSASEGAKKAVSGGGSAAVSTNEARATLVCVVASGSMRAVVRGRRPTLKVRYGMKLALNFIVGVFLFYKTMNTVAAAAAVLEEDAIVNVVLEREEGVGGME
jgi:hypothetical protein